MTEATSATNEVSSFPTAAGMAPASNRQAAALLALRASLGMLLVWWGLAKVLKPAMGVNVQSKFYANMFDSSDLQLAFGFVQIAVGLLVVVGLFRAYAVIAQLAITGFSSAMIWSALLDPFAMWLPIAKVAPVQHLFYPSVIALCGAMVMMAFRKEDRFNLDTMLARTASPKVDNGPVGHTEAVTAS